MRGSLDKIREGGWRVKKRIIYRSPRSKNIANFRIINLIWNTACMWQLFGDETKKFFNELNESLVT